MARNLITLLIVIGLWAWFPTFGPMDIISFSIIAKLGINTYLFYSAIFLIIAYFLIEGKGISGKIKIIVADIKYIIRKVFG